MSDNIVLNANNPNQVIVRAANNAGVYTPHNHAELWVANNPVSNSNQIPVTDSGFSGSITQIAVSVNTTSSTLVAANAYVNFARVLVDANQTSGVWVNWAAGSANSNPPNEHLRPGDTITWSRRNGFLPTTQWNAISDSVSNVTVTIMGN